MRMSTNNFLCVCVFLGPRVPVHCLRMSPQILRKTRGNARVFFAVCFRCRIFLCRRGRFFAIFEWILGGYPPPGPPRDGKRRAGGARRAPGSIFDGFWFAFGLRLGALLEAFWDTVLFCCALCRILGVILGVLEKRAETELPRGGGHAICPRRRVFCKGRPLLFWLRFGLHFGVILGARAVTIRILGRLFGKTVSFCQSCFAGVFLVDFGCRPGGVGGWEP